MSDIKFKTHKHLSPQLMLGKSQFSESSVPSDCPLHFS